MPREIGHMNRIVQSLQRTHESLRSATPVVAEPVKVLPLGQDVVEQAPLVLLQAMNGFVEGRVVANCCIRSHGVVERLAHLGISASTTSGTTYDYAALLELDIWIGNKDGIHDEGLPCC